MRIKNNLRDTLYRFVTEHRYRKWLKTHYPQSNNNRDQHFAQIKHFEKKPVVSVVLPVYNAKPIWIRKAVESVKNQIYPHYQLCIADDKSTDHSTLRYLKQIEHEEKIQIIYRKENGHISAASNSALELAIGEYVCFLDHDDELAPQALFRVVQAINRSPHLMFLYSDEDKINEKGLRSEPHFKSSWNPELLRSYNYINHLAVYCRERLMAMGGLREGYEGAQDYDLILRYTEGLQDNQIAHLPEILYHWRKISTSTAYEKEVKPYVGEAGRLALTDHLSRSGVEATVNAIPDLTNTFHVQYALKKQPLISIVIPTRDHADMLRRCIESIRAKTAYPMYEILIVNNRSEEQNTLDYLLEIEDIDNIRVIPYDKEFNYSALNNYAVSEAGGDVVCLLNNDTEVISAGWLETMLGFLQQTDVGAVGAQLLYPDETLQHAGVILGIGGGAGHSHKYKDANAWGYMARANVSQNLSAVTGACLLTYKKDFLRVGGLDEEDFSIAFNDIDYCLKLREVGLKVAYTPLVKLYHFESKSRGLDTDSDKARRFEKEKENLKSKWGALLQKDPYYNPNLSLSREDFSLSNKPRAINDEI